MFTISFYRDKRLRSTATLGLIYELKTALGYLDKVRILNILKDFTASEVTSEISKMGRRYCQSRGSEMDARIAQDRKGWHKLCPVVWEHGL